MPSSLPVSLRSVSLKVVGLREIGVSGGSISYWLVSREVMERGTYCGRSVSSRFLAHAWLCHPLLLLLLFLM